MKNLAKLAMISAAPAALMATATPAAAGTDEYIGEVMLVGYNFCPRSSTEAAGQLLPISQYSALFSLYGTTYGGDGRTTMGLPDLRGRTVIGQGTGPGLTTRPLGQRSGAEEVTLITSQIPAHSHTGQVRAEHTAQADTGNPSGNAIGRTTTPIYSDTATPASTGALHSGTLHIDVSGGGNQAHPNMQPYLAMRYCVVLEGVYPSRN
ncbi:phage tail protein [Pontixanthobacter aquaemixtae]|uniref:Phage tail protein n=1 Tax=Pontixanthobacter aquaemixtae TaxID=1958940 RepID=A0A844ZSV2_9SPHN|nr:tail fiber protein [Pontixanthobacter aquaemixtae]MXO90564.1 phage tail protein [Pontixanthobacter aquaemixtae]